MSVTLNPFRKKLLFCLSAFFAASAAIGQHTSPAALHSIKPSTDLDQRFYYTSGGVQNVWGYRIGALINDTYKLGIGGYYMSETTAVDVQATAFSRTAAPAYAINKKLYLGTVYYEPYLLRRKLWETSLVFETGYGRTVTHSAEETSGKTSYNNNALIIPAGAGLSVNLKLPALFHLQCFRWIGINAMAGYRTSIYQQDKEFDYNGAYWSLSGAVFLDRMFEDFHTWKKDRIAAREKRVIQLSY